MTTDELTPAYAMVRPRHPAVIVLIATAALLRLVIAWMPGEWLLRRVLADDPFYYFTIARNFGHGHGPTFDGFQPTNGFHPLWLFIITPIFAGISDVWTAVHVALTLAAVVDVLALLLLVVLLRELEVGHAIALAATTLYAFSPLLLSLAGPLNGLETPVSLLAIFAFLIVYRRLAVDPQPGLQLLGLSVSAALVFLARTDTAIMLLFAFASLFWRMRGNHRARYRLVLAGLVAACLAAPWLAWSWTRFGSPVQVSGLAAAYVTRVMFNGQGATWLDYASKAVRNLAALAAYVPVGVGVASTLKRRALANVVFVVALAGAATLAARASSAADRRAFRARLEPWWPLLLAAFTFIVVHTLRAVELRSWYFTELVPTVLVMLALAADSVSRFLATRSPAIRRYAAAAAALILVAMLVNGWRVGLGSRCGEIDAYAAVLAANRTLPPGTRVGAWNAGLFGYFYERGQVVDLDGLVDNAAYRHILDRSVGAYSAERQIDYLLDADLAIDFGRLYWGVDRRFSFPAHLGHTETSHACRRILLVPLVPQSI